MILYFSGAKHYKSEQTDVNQSLGGFMSSTPIPNSRLNALFDDVSAYFLRNRIKHTIAIFLYNNSNMAVKDVSMTNIYQKVLGQKINLCEFEFSVIEPTEEGYIEIIGSKNEEPFYIDWFNCESERESVQFKVLTSGNIGDQISILGFSGIVDGFGIKEGTDKLFELASKNTDFIVNRISDNEILITRKNLGVTYDDIMFSTNGFMTIDSDGIFEGVEGNVIISELIEPGKAIGIWIKRKVREDYTTIDDGDCKVYNDKGLIKNESLELIFNFENDPYWIPIDKNPIIREPLEPGNDFPIGGGD